MAKGKSQSKGPSHTSKPPPSGKGPRPSHPQAGNSQRSPNPSKSQGAKTAPSKPPTTSGQPSKPKAPQPNRNSHPQPVLIRSQNSSNGQRPAAGQPPKAGHASTPAHGAGNGHVRPQAANGTSKSDTGRAQGTNGGHQSAKRSNNGTANHPKAQFHAPPPKSLSTSSAAGQPSQGQGKASAGFLSNFWWPKQTQSSPGGDSTVHRQHTGKDLSKGHSSPHTSIPRSTMPTAAGGQITNLVGGSGTKQEHKAPQGNTAMKSSGNGHANLSKAHADGHSQASSMHRIDQCHSQKLQNIASSSHEPPSSPGPKAEHKAPQGNTTKKSSGNGHANLQKAHGDGNPQTSSMHRGDQRNQSKARDSASSVHESPLSSGTKARPEAQRDTTMKSPGPGHPSPRKAQGDGHLQVPSPHRNDKHNQPKAGGILPSIHESPSASSTKTQHKDQGNTAKSPETGHSIPLKAQGGEHFQASSMHSIDQHNSPKPGKHGTSDSRSVPQSPHNGQTPKPNNLGSRPSSVAQGPNATISSKGPSTAPDVCRTKGHPPVMQEQSPRPDKAPNKENPNTLVNSIHQNTPLSSTKSVMTPPKASPPATRESNAKVPGSQSSGKAATKQLPKHPALKGNSSTVNSSSPRGPSVSLALHARSIHSKSQAMPKEAENTGIFSRLASFFSFNREAPPPATPIVNHQNHVSKKPANNPSNGSTSVNAQQVFGTTSSSHVDAHEHMQMAKESQRTGRSNVAATSPKPSMGSQAPMLSDALPPLKSVPMKSPPNHEKSKDAASPPSHVKLKEQVTNKALTSAPQSVKRLPLMPKDDRATKEKLKTAQEATVPSGSGGLLSQLSSLFDWSGSKPPASTQDAADKPLSKSRESHRTVMPPPTVLGTKSNKDVSKPLASTHAVIDKPSSNSRQNDRSKTLLPSIPGPKTDEATKSEAVRPKPEKAHKLRVFEVSSGRHVSRVGRLGNKRREMGSQLGKLNREKDATRSPPPIESLKAREDTGRPPKIKSVTSAKATSTSKGKSEVPTKWTSSVIPKSLLNLISTPKPAQAAVAKEGQQPASARKIAEPASVQRRVARPQHQVHSSKVFSGPTKKSITRQKGGLLRRFAPDLIWRKSDRRGVTAALATETAAPLPSPPENELRNKVARRTIAKHPEIFKVVSPINVDRFEELMENHPNQPFVKSVVRGLREGFWPLADTSDPKLPTTNDNSRASTLSPEKEEFLRKQRDEEVRLGRWSEAIGPKLLPGMYSSPITAVPKKTPGDYRLVVDQSRGHHSLNSMIPKSQYKIKLDNAHDLGNVLLAVRKRHGTKKKLEMFKSDVKSAYRLLPMHPLWQIRQAVKVDGQYHIDRSNTFGNRAGGWIWDSFISLVLWAGIKEKGIKDLLGYVDDEFSYEFKNEKRYYKPYKKHLPAKQARLLELWDELGVPHDENKQLYGPSLPIIGFQVNPNAMTIDVPAEKKAKVIQMLRDAAHEGKPYTLQKLQSVAGSVNSVLNLYPHLRPGLRELFDEMAGKKGANTEMRVTGPVARSLSGLADYLENAKSVPIRRIEGKGSSVKATKRILG